MLDDLDLNAIQDKNAREVIMRLLNMIEQLSAELREVCRTQQWALSAEIRIPHLCHDVFACDTL